jgi:4-amino-4-deoxy-L-arabinose transferase-like glycosyltransferase
MLVLIGSIRIVSSYGVFSHTMDEPTHLGAGMQYLSTGLYTYEQAHTPLARVFAAIGPYLAGERFHNGPIPYTESFRILGTGQHYQRILTLGRLGILPFFWVASLVVFLWGNRCAGPTAALIATLLFTTLPPVLAHSGLITTDMALTAMVAAAAYASLVWCEKPSLAHTVGLGLTVGLAVLAKISAIPYLGAAWVLMYAWHLFRGRPGARGALREVRSRWLSAVGAFAIACLTIWAVYSFHVGPFFGAFTEVWKHNQDGHASYLLGQRRHFGTWYFFPVTLAVKTPLAMLLMLLWSPWLLRRSHVAAAVAFSAGVLLFAMTTRINIGVRHILPVYVGFSIICGAAAACVLEDPARRWRPVPIAVLALLAWHVASGALQHPDYIPYTNEIAGSHPENFVADSDLDWGQDMKRLGEYFQRIGVSEITFRPYSITYVEMGGPPLPRMLPSAWDHPSPGWNAVSLSGWKVFNHPGWVNGREPQVRIGRTTWLWYFPLSSQSR